MTKRKIIAEIRDAAWANPRLERQTNGGLMFVPAEGAKPILDCRVARCFPWSIPDRHISIRDSDGNELHLFGSIQDVPEHSRELVIEELAAQEFIPKILRVHEINDTFEILIWKAETDRGPIEFQVRDEDIRTLGDNHVVIKDDTGILFDVPDLGALDETSRLLIEDRLN